MIDISQEPGERATIRLDPTTGEQLRSLIIQSTEMNFTRFVESRGLQPTNVANYLSGRNPLALSTLAKLLAGTNLQLQCKLQVVITSGKPVEDVDCMPLDEMSYFTELDTLEEDSITIPEHRRPPTPSSSLSEKPQEHKKTTADSPSKEPRADYFT